MSARTSKGPARRAFRVFVSSTFLDMHAEREVLAKRVFPRLRHVCESRGVAWGEVDLRWGITAEQSAERGALPICLEEIRACRPYFIGMVGERYGMVVGQIPPELRNTEPWLCEVGARSITELEMLHGALNDPEMAQHSFFYLRDPAYVDRLPAGAVRANFVSDDRDAAEKLRVLKERIRASGLPVREGYADPDALGDLVLRDLTEVLDRLFPAGEAVSPLDAEEAEQQAFVRSRTEVYVERPELLSRLDEHVASDGPPLVVLGEPGVGKSALLACWASQANPAGRAGRRAFRHFHFVGASGSSAAWPALAGRLLGELDRKLKLALAKPHSADDARSALAAGLQKAAARVGAGRIVIVLDGLNQLEDRDGGGELRWLPTELPSNVRLILSGLGDAALQTVAQRGWPALKVEPLATKERRTLAAAYLETYRKTLPAELLELVVSAPQSANPLCLRVLLEELRLHGRRETLTVRAKELLAAATIEDLYDLVLARSERDYDSERPRLVADSMALLWAARTGLSESELLDVLGAAGAPLPHAFWSPFLLSMRQGLVDRSGRLGFVDGHLRQAVHRRYVTDQVIEDSLHRLLGEYFSTRPASSRRLEEEPWQWAAAKDWPRLVDVLRDPELLDRLCAHSKPDVYAYLAQLEREDERGADEVFWDVIDSPEGHPDAHLMTVSKLLSTTGHARDAVRIDDLLIEGSRLERGSETLGAVCLSRAASAMQLGEIARAEQLYLEAEDIFRALGKAEALQEARELRATALLHFGALDEAGALLEESEAAHRRAGDARAIARVLGRKAVIARARGELRPALALHGQEEAGYRSTQDERALQACLQSKALVLLSLGDLPRASDAIQEAIRICRERGWRHDLQGCLGPSGAILRRQGDAEGALASWKEQEALGRAMDAPAGLEMALGNQASILCDRGEHPAALTLLEEREAICRRLGAPGQTIPCLADKALLLARHLDRAPEAVKLAEEALSLLRQHDLEIHRPLVEEALREARQPTKVALQELKDDAVAETETSQERTKHEEARRSLAQAEREEEAAAAAKDWDLVTRCQAHQAFLTLDAGGEAESALRRADRSRQTAMQHGLFALVRDLVDPLFTHIRSSAVRAEQSKPLDRAHADTVVACRFSPHGGLLASAGVEGSVRLWELPGGACRATLPHAKGRLAMAFLSDGHRLVAGDSEGAVYVWDARPGQATLELAEHGGPVHAVAVSADGRRVVWGSGEDVRVADITGERGPRFLGSHEEAILDVAVSRDGRLALSAGRDKVLMLWDLERGTRRAILSGHLEMVVACAIAPGGHVGASASSDGSVWLWDLRRGARTRVLVHGTQVESCGFTADGRSGISADRAGIVARWDVATGLSVANLQGHADGVAGLAIAPDGVHVLVADWKGQVHLWDSVRGVELSQVTVAQAECLDLHPTQPLAACGTTDGRVFLFPLAAPYGPIVVLAPTRPGPLACPACANSLDVREGSMACPACGVRLRVVPEPEPALEAEPKLPQPPRPPASPAPRRPVQSPKRPWWRPWG